MRIIGSLILALVLLYPASTSQAETACETRTHAITQLQAQFKERVSGRGLAANGALMMELFVSKSGSWTILATDPQGRSCLVAEGQHWRGIRPAVGEGV